MMEVNARASASLEAKVIRKDGTVEDLGEIWNSESNKNTKIEEEQNDGTSR